MYDLWRYILFLNSEYEEHPEFSLKKEEEEPGQKLDQSALNKKNYDDLQK